MPSSGRQLTLIILVIYGSHQIAITQEVQQQKQSKIDTHLKVYTQKIQRQDKTIQHQGNSAVGEEVTRETSQPINVHRSHHFSKVYRVLFKFRSSRNVGRFKRNATLNASATPPETNSSSVPQNQDTTEPTQSNSTVPFVWPSHFLVTQPATSRGTSLTPELLRAASGPSEEFLNRKHTAVLVGSIVTVIVICVGITYIQATSKRKKKRHGKFNIKFFKKRKETRKATNVLSAELNPDVSAAENPDTELETKDSSSDALDIERPSKDSATERPSKVKRATKNSAMKSDKVRRKKSVQFSEDTTPGSSSSNDDESPTSPTSPTSDQDLDHIRSASSFNIVYTVDSEKEFFYG